ncbi:hypothetical protein [Cupriavidus pinatubonensis]|uniref:Uncharacterized protein n=1 Tax=Cupriavidus pinatubonensis TaxID=248026 RepID=A0ABN7YB67_9BURK|nr:hypothetical protein [Cupriavidus pinatubonensis]CAG9169941.1 hypothetical protein LMG23994_01740 [Cupriavidus pinatubonensis]
MYRIDPARPMSIYGSVTRDLSKMTQDPMHDIVMDLAQKTLNTGFLRLADPVDEASFDVPPAQFLEWLIGESSWASEFFEHLQCVAETAAGEPLLTTWLGADRFWSMLSDGRGVPAVEAIAARVDEWRSLGLDEVYFGFHVMGSSAVHAQVEVSALPVTV